MYANKHAALLNQPGTIYFSLRPYTEDLDRQTGSYATVCGM